MNGFDAVWGMALAVLGKELGYGPGAARVRLGHSSGAVSVRFWYGYFRTRIRLEVRLDVQFGYGLGAVWVRFVYGL